jgi:hypothetical protein
MLAEIVFIMEKILCIFSAGEFLQRLNYIMEVDISYYTKILSF